MRLFYAQEAQHKLERGRYVNFGDWLHRWETLEPQHLETTREFINACVRGENPSVREWQKETQGPKALAIETARYLTGERGPEPAVEMAAERLGLITLNEPPIDAEFLAQLTDSLPPLVFHTNPDAQYDPDDESEPFDGFDYMVA